MKSKPLMLLLVAAGCGLVAMLGVQQILTGGKQAVPKIRVYVARAEIEAGIRLDSTKNVGVKEFPKEAVPEGAVTKEEEFADRSLKHRIGPGQPLLLSELGNKGEYGLDIKIPPEMRLASVSVTATMTHSGLLKPGNFVDVNAAVEMPVKGGAKRTEVKPVLQCIQVFAIDSQVVGSEESKDAKAKDAKNVTFLLYPLQAQLLHLASKQSNGGLQFVLRSGSDKNVVNSTDLTEQSLTMLSNSLLGHQEEPERKTVADKRAQAAKPMNAFRSYVAPETSPAVISVGDQAGRRTWKIEIFQGDQREVQELDWPEETSQEAKGTSGKVSNPWTNPLMKFFNRRQKEASPVDAQPTSLFRREDAQDSAVRGSKIEDGGNSTDKE